MGFENIGANSPLLLPPTMIVNRYSAGGATSQIALFNDEILFVASGALSAGVYKEILLVSGRGVIQICAAVRADATSRQVGLKVVIDGVTVFDAYDADTAATSKGLVAIGIPTGASGAILPSPKPFTSSLSISVKSSLDETDKIKLLYDYYTTA